MGEGVIVAGGHPTRVAMLPKSGNAALRDCIGAAMIGNRLPGPYAPDGPLASVVGRPR